MGQPGRPSSYSEEMVVRICEELAEGKTLREICRADGMPAASTVILWCTTHPEFSERYARARQAGLDVIAEEIVEISDDATNDWMERQGKTELNMEHIQRSRLRVDARKWLLSKLAPKKYGDRLELAGDEKNPLVVVSVAQRIRDRRAKLREGAGE